MFRRPAALLAVGCFFLVGCAESERARPALLPTDPPQRPMMAPEQPQQRAATQDLPAPAPGGETTSFVPSPCLAVREAFPIEVADAEAVGFHVRIISGWLERPIDAPLHWSEPPTAKPKTWSVSGYQPDTRVQAQIQVTSLEHVRLSPKYCDGTTCRLGNGKPFEAAGCTHTLRMHLDIALRTLDGALDVSTNGLLELDSGDFGNPVDSHTYHSYALADIEGALEIRDDTHDEEPLLQIMLETSKTATTGRIYAELGYRPNGYANPTALQGDLPPLP